MLSLSKLNYWVFGALVATGVLLSSETTVYATDVGELSATSADVKTLDDTDPDYWTAERRFAAEPMTLDKIKGGFVVDESPIVAHARNVAEPVVLADPVGPADLHDRSAFSDDKGSVDDTVHYGDVPPTVGRLYMTHEGEEGHCTASVVNNTHRNIIMTAAHCVHGGVGGDWYENFKFYPMYDNGPAPGQRAWGGNRVMAPHGWIHESKTEADQAFIELKPSGFRTIVDVVGGNGLIFGGDQARDDVVAWGYPGQYSYNGKTPYFCEGDTRQGRLIRSYAVLNCDFNGGASGGPWLVDREDEGRGYIYAVTAKCGSFNIPMKGECLGDPRVIMAAPNGVYAESMFEKIETGDWSSDEYLG